MTQTGTRNMTREGSSMSPSAAATIWAGSGRSLRSSASRSLENATAMTETGALGDDEYTIDQLATMTRVPSRTIRFYQSKGALQPPQIRGRVAFYGAAHVERLKLIGSLQDRGLSIRAIRDLLQQADK